MLFFKSIIHQTNDSNKGRTNTRKSITKDITQDNTDYMNLTLQKKVERMKKHFFRKIVHLVLTV